MAVVVQCYHCNTILELDEGFRGGVCRCSTCGSLLQVPKATSAAAPKARPAAPGAEPTQTNRPAAPSGDTGLSRGQFDPASHPGSSGKRPAIPDFGGSSSGLRSAGRPAAPTATAKTPRTIEKVEPVAGATRPARHLKQVKHNNMLLYISISLLGAILVTAIVMAVVMITRQEEKPPDRTLTQPGSGSGKQPAPVRQGSGREPSRIEPPTAVVPAPVPARPVIGFLDIPLTGKKIVLSIDGASSMSDNFDYVRNGVYQAVERLGPGQEIRVAIWRDDKVIPFPAKGFIGKAGLKQLQQEYDSLGVRGSSDAAGAMSASLKLGGDQVIFVTAKPAMDPGIADTVLAANTGKIHLDSIKLDSEDTPSPMEEVARKTGGTFHFISGTQLQELSR